MIFNSYSFKTTILFEGQRFASNSIDIFRRTHDGCLMYIKNGSISISFMEIIQKLAFRRGVSVNFPPTPNSMFFSSIS